MSIPAYAFVNDLPPPVTTGTAAQFFTDVMGEVWVARNGVSGGAWARARSVLYCRVCRSAAYNSPGLNTVFVFDAVVDDVYGLFASPNISVPIPGQWLAGATVEITPTVAADVCAFYLYIAGAGMRSGSASATSGLTPIRSTTSAVVTVPSVPASIGVTAEYMTAGRGVALGDGRTYMWAKYVGA